MSNSDIPDGADYQTTQLAIAWAMAKQAILPVNGESGEEHLGRLLEAYAKALKAVKESGAT